MTEDHTETAELYRSSLTSKPLTMKKSRVIVVGDDEVPSKPQFDGEIVKADLSNDPDYKAIEEINIFYWGAVEQDIFGRLYNVFDYDNYLARDPDSGKVVGHICVTPEKVGFMHIVVIHVCPEWHGRGVGRKLIELTIHEAKKAGLKTIKLATTNDNIPALYFYQRLGFVIDGIIPEVVADDHSVPPNGFAGIPVRDEIHLRLDL